MAKDKPNKPSLAALKARMDSLQELIAFERDAPRRFDLIQELLLTNELVAEIEKAHKNKGQLIVKSKPVLNAALYLFLFTTLN